MFFRLDKRDERRESASRAAERGGNLYEYQRQRLLVKPGMTCYWQIRHNCDSITFDEWVDLDL